ncbi:MAG: DUF2332 domain-containing protein [Nocardioidaceae bacterium]
MTLGFDAGETLAARMRAHAGDSDHLYGHLMRSMADDWEAAGPTWQICRGWEGAPTGAVVQLRLLAGLFRIVLTGRAPELVEFYPCLGGSADPSEAWPVVLPVLAEHMDELHSALDVAPQTNEVGRSQALLVGLFEAVRCTGLRRVRLLEPGASAGLNLLVDEFCFKERAWRWGRENSPLVLRDWLVGDVIPQAFEIVDRRGCDLSPVDASSSEGKLRLRSFVWPFHVQRHERLTAALEVAADHPVRVDAVAAGEWLAQRLGEPTPDETLTAVWQSITQQYWPAEEIARVDAALEEAGGQGLPLAHVSMEYPSKGPAESAVLSLRLPGRQRDADVLATVGDHGTPVTLLPQSP